MVSRDSLWRRLGGSAFGGLPWVLAAACAVPWLVPETWDGRLEPALQRAGWLLVGACLPLARFRWGIWPALALAAAWAVLGGLARQARWDAGLPAGVTEVLGQVDAPWILRERALAGSIRVEAPPSLRGAALPITVPRGGAPPPPPGTPVRFRAELRPVAPGPAFLAERPVLRARDRGAPRRARLASALALEILGPPRPGPALRIRAWFHARLASLPLAPASRDLWGALALGIPPAREEVSSAFARSGTIHLLVVSGLQVTLVVGAAEAAWRRLAGRGSPWAAAAAGLGYGLLVGFSAPVWRGLAMGLAWAAGRGSGWKLPPAPALHGALLARAATHPGSGCDPGFLLSWLALTGLIWGSEPLAGLLAPVAGPLKRLLARVLAPWLSTLPLLALFHGGAPLWGAAANLVFLPLAAVLVPACLGALLLPLPWAVAALDAGLAWVGQVLAPAFARVAPLAAQWTAPWAALALGWVLLGRLHCAFRRTRALAAALVLATAALVAARGAGASPGAFSVEALDVGQGDALLLRVPGGDATLVDTGPDARSARRIARVLSRRGVREPVHLVLTHPHQDHAGGWKELAALWPLASVSRPAMDAGPWRGYGPEGARAAELLRGDAWRRGEAGFAVRWPPKAMDLRDLNMNSAVLRVRWRDREVWFMGDALASQERDLLDLGDPGAWRPGRVLKAGHHGSRSASDPAWAAALDPRIALVCAGRDNPFGHPHREALEALGEDRALVTGATLGIRLEAREGGWKVELGDGGSGFLADGGRGIPPEVTGPRKRPGPAAPP